jgi:hypothetical protein
MTPDLPRILRMKDLVASGRVPNKVTGYRWMKEGLLPLGRLYGPNVRGWTQEELAAHDAALPTDLKPSPMRGRKRPLAKRPAEARLQK